MTIKEALQYAKEYVNSIEARVLLKYILKKDNVYIISNASTELTPDEEKELINSVNKLKSGYPLQYITHNQEFMGLNFYVDENVLIPQPDTEVLVENAIKLISKNLHQNILTEFQKQDASFNEFEKNESANNLKILDLCTGSGAIAISIKKYLPNAQVFASDISTEALSIAEKNAKSNEVEIKFIKSNMFENIKENFDIIVSNPPYIRTQVINTLAKEVKNEPIIALDGGEDGLYFYKKIINEAFNFLADNGMIFLEIGFDQKEELEKLIKADKRYELVKTKKDLGDNDRIVVVKKL